MYMGHLPVTWKANRRARVTSALFEEWLRKLDNKMTLKKRMILLFLDNTPCHPDLELYEVLRCVSFQLILYHITINPWTKES